MVAGLRDRGADDARSPLGEPFGRDRTADRGARAADCLGAGVPVSPTAPAGCLPVPSRTSLARRPSTRTATAARRRVLGRVMDGVAAPLVYDDAAIGLVLLHDEPARSRRVIGVVKAMSELLIHQAAVIERLPDRRRLVDQFLAALLLGHFSPECDAPVRRGAAEIDLRVPRVVVAFDVGVCLSWLACDGTPHAAVPESRARRLDRRRAW
ncbi:MAG: sugar diacid recognition domain-containing protein [Dehalococcoidia bacterium]